MYVVIDFDKKESHVVTDICSYANNHLTSKLDDHWCRTVYYWGEIDSRIIEAFSNITVYNKQMKIVNIWDLLDFEVVSVYCDEFLSDNIHKGITPEIRESLNNLVTASSFTNVNDLDAKIIRWVEHTYPHKNIKMHTKIMFPKDYFKVKLVKKR